MPVSFVSWWELAKVCERVRFIADGVGWEDEEEAEAEAVSLSSTSEEVLGRCDRMDCLRYIGGAGY
jgi:hypothetical protein